jgi:hypothetical protein
MACAITTPFQRAAAAEVHARIRQHGADASGITNLGELPPVLAALA